MTTARDPHAPRSQDAHDNHVAADAAELADKNASAAAPEATDETISEEQATRIIEEFESESPTRRIGGAWRWIAGVLAAGVSIYALYYTQFTITTQVYRATFLLLALALTFILYPAWGRNAERPTNRNLAFRALGALVVGAIFARWLWGTVPNAAKVATVLALVWLVVHPLLRPAFTARPALLDIPLSLAGALACGYVLAAATEAYMGARFGLAPTTWRWTAIALTLVVTAVAYPLLQRGALRDRIAPYDLHLALMSGASLIFLSVNFQSALQRITRPTPVEVLLGLGLILLTLEATRRTTGWALPITAGFFLLYGLYGNLIPGTFGHRGYRIDRIVGQNYLTLEGIFGTPLEVAATFIVLFTIYGAVLEYSGAGKFFIDWSFAALGKSGSGTGPGRTVTAAGFLLGTVSGSGVATTVTLGSLAWPMLKRAGYDRNVAGGLLSAAGIGALLSPPTLGAAAFIIAEYLEVSYLQVLIYATIPTVLYYLSCLLMVEADSRRMKTHAVEIETPPLWELTAKFGYHFTSLFVIVILLAVGITPFMAVFLSIVAAFALSFLRPETRLTSLRALAVGAVLGAIVLVRDLVTLNNEGRFANLGNLSVPELLNFFAPLLGRASFLGMMLTAVISAGLLLSRRLQAPRADALAASAAGAAPAGVGTAGHTATAGGGESSRLLQALESGGKGTISIAATTATAGVIVSIVTLTGLGQKLSGQIVDLAGGSLFFTVLFAAVAVWILGLAVPVTASYIIAAVMIVPALEQLGVEPAAAHMFIFYYAVLADVSPPTALAPFAAAALTGGNPFRTTMLAWKYCLPAFLVPFMFTLSRDGESILMIGSWTTIAWTFITACLAIAALAIAFGGWFIRQAALPERVLAGAAGLALLLADVRADGLGFALLIAATAVHLLLGRAKGTPPQPVGAGAD